MVILSKHTANIPALDLLSYLFDNSALRTNVPLFIDSTEPDKKVTKDELEVLVRRIGYGLRESAKLCNSEVALICAANSILFPALLLGTICAGGIFTGANPEYTTEELIHQIRVSEAKILFTDSERARKVIGAAEALGIHRSCIFVIDAEANLSSNHGCRALSELIQGPELQWEKLDRLDVVSERTAVLNFSSGTTGPPKACMITHHNLVANTEQVIHLDKLAMSRSAKPDKEVVNVHCAYVPLFHAMGMHAFCIVNVKREYSTVIMKKFGLAPLLDVVQKFRVSELLTPPPVAVLIIKSPLAANYDLSSVKALMCGAAPLGRDTSIQLEQAFAASGARVRQGYGMTEATCAITLFAPDEVDPTHSGVGYLCANMQAKVVDDDGNEVGAGEVGEALLRGPNIFKGYWKNHLATQDAWTSDGWMKTGDYVIVSSDGLFSVVDRKKELIKVKGFQVAPAELEAILLKCEYVQDCAVIRVFRNGNECPQAHVVPKGKDATSRAILEFMEKSAASYKRLTGGLVFTDSIPKSPSGKILKRLIKDSKGELGDRPAKL